MAAWHLAEVPWSAAEQQPAPDVTMATSSWPQYVAMIVDYAYLKRIICTQGFAMSQKCMHHMLLPIFKSKSTSLIGLSRIQERPIALQSGKTEHLVR